MNDTYLVVIALAVASALNQLPRRGTAPRQRDLGVAGFTSLAFACLLNAGCFAASLDVDRRAVAYQMIAHAQPWWSWPVWSDRIPAPSGVSDLTLGLAALQSCALLWVFFLLRHGIARRPHRLLVGATSLALVGMALASTTLKSSDLYAYAGIGRLGVSAYRSVGAFSGDYSAVNYYWGTPMVPDVYGPLWTWLTQVFYGSGVALTRLMFELRGIEVVAFVAVVVVLRLLHYGDAVVAVFAMNGAIVDQFVRDGHNDLFAVALILIAFALVRFPAIAALLVAGAIAVKLSFLAVGAMVFTHGASRRSRLLAFSAAALGGLGGSYALLGPAYPAAILTTSGRVSEGIAVRALHLLAIGVVAVSCAVGLWFGRFAAGAAFAPVALGLLPAPWYLLWGFPYAIRAGAAGAFLISLPFLANVFSMSYAFTPARAVLFFLVVVAALFTIVRALGALGRTRGRSNRALTAA